jgi:hypothetical protein
MQFQGVLLKTILPNLLDSCDLKQYGNAVDSLTPVRTFDS